MGKKEALKTAASEPPAVVEAVVETVVVPVDTPAAPEAPVVVVMPTSGSDNPADWKVADVIAFLDAVELSMHADAFKTHSVDGKILLALDEQELYKVLNIVSPLHRKKLMMAIADLRANYLNP